MYLSADVILSGALVKMFETGLGFNSGMNVN